MATIFSRIISGEIPSYRVAESEAYYAFLDINPVQAGHVLVVPKQEVDYFFDLSPESLSGIMEFARMVASAIQCATHCIKVGVSVVGLEVPHAHVHLIPLNELGDMNLKHKVEMSGQELQEMAVRIRAFVPQEYL